MTDQGRDEEGTAPRAPGADGESEVERDAAGTTQPIGPTEPTQAVPVEPGEPVEPVDPVEQSPPSQWPYASPPPEAQEPYAGSPFGPPAPTPEAQPPYGAPYGTPPPPEAQPPYGAAYGTPAPPPDAPPYGAPQYGQTGYPAPQYGAPGYPAPGYPMGPVRPPEAQSLRTQAITALILNILAVLFCCGLASIGGAIMAGLAIGRVDTDLPVARRQVAWSWGLLAANLVIALIVAGILIAALGASSSRP
jgi:hypothetical protein